MSDMQPHLSWYCFLYGADSDSYSIQHILGAITAAANVFNHH